MNPIIDTVFAIIFSILGLALLCCIYFLIRNQMVYSFRIKILHQDPEAYRKLPDYVSMLHSIKPLKLKHWVK